MKLEDQEMAVGLLAFGSSLIRIFALSSAGSQGTAPLSFQLCVGGRAEVLFGVEAEG